MNHFWRRRCAMALAFAFIAALVVGGLGWATRAALGLERERREAAALAERTDKLRLAMWRLDSRIAPALAREDSRPFTHYSALHAPLGAMKADGVSCPAGSVWLPSPLINAELPEWMVLHFQIDRAAGWKSPQVISPQLAATLQQQPYEISLNNVTDRRAALLQDLAERYPAAGLMARLREAGLTAPDAFIHNNTLFANRFEQDLNAGVPDARWSAPPQQALGSPQEYNMRSQVQSRGFREGKGAYQSDVRNYLPLGSPPGNSSRPSVENPVEVRLGSMAPVWLDGPGESPELLVVRVAQVGEEDFFQGILLDWPALSETLLAEVGDLFPGARLLPLRHGEAAAPEQTMTALPVILDPGPMPALPPPGWTPLRAGLALAWLAALVALAAVGLGGRSLLGLSERRIRFVSAVTHELRTPLTTLRLYLDLLTSGMVRDERTREEYLGTLHNEADRLHRLISNVLDFARLEKKRPALKWQAVPVADFLARLRQTWDGRCGAAGKRLEVDCRLPPDARLWTDEKLLEQILGNLIDNAQKHTREADDPHIWLRAVAAGPGRVALEVEDRGPGVAKGEARGIFRPFRRGRGTDATGGVGLGLALAERWAALLHGRLTTCKPAAGVGACFRLELPATPQKQAGDSSAKGR